MALLLDWSPTTKRDLDKLFSESKDALSVMQDFGEYKRRKIVLLMPSRAKGVSSPAGQPPAKHTASLSQSITYNATARGLEVGTTDVRGRMLQEGGDIRPKRAKALTVPVDKDAYGKRARDFADLFMVKPKSGGAFLARKRGKTETIQILFALLGKVTILAHPYLFWTDEDEDRLSTLNQREFEGES